VDTLLHVGLSNALTATLLALPVALIARVGRRPALTHALWILVLLKLVTPPLVALPLPWPDPLAADAQEVVPPRVDVGAAPLPQPQDLPPFLEEPGAGDAAEEAHEGLPRQRQAEAVPAPPTPAGPDGKSLLLAVWLTGSALWWLTACLRVARFRRLLRYTAPAPAEVQAQARRLAERLGLTRCPGVWLLAARVSPLLWALGRVPRLLLPADLWQALTPEQRDTLLAHELAHLRRRDHWVRRLELLVLGLFWWHPVAWWARHELSEAEEACCDAWVLWALPEAGPAYAAALVETVAFLSPARRPVPVAASGAGRVKTLKRRLRMILQRPSPRALSGAGLLAVLGLGGLLLPLLPTWADEQAAESRGAPARPAAEQPPDPPLVPRTPAAPAPESPPFRRAKVFPPTDRAPQPEAPAGRDLAELIQKARDEVELLEAQVEVKRAQLKAAAAALEFARQNFARVQRLAGAVSSEELRRVQAEVTRQEAEVTIKQAELRVPEVHLAQARRRLAALQRQTGGDEPAPSQLSWAARLFDRRVVEVHVPKGSLVKTRFQLTNTTGERIQISSVRNSAGALSAVASRTTLAPGEKGYIDVMVDGRRFTSPKHFTVFVTFDQPRPAEVRLIVQAVKAETAPIIPPAPADDRERLKSLEDKLDRLLKEVEELRKKLPPRGTKGARLGFGPEGTDAMQIEQRRFVLAAQIQPAERPRIKEVRLFMSADEGRTWQQVGAQSPELHSFRVEVPRDGLYWFKVATVDRTGKQEPADVNAQGRALEVLVRTKKG
jgi:beta-lactamase regulating signal transducer with metallopeptidase domain